MSSTRHLIRVGKAALLVVLVGALTLSFGRLGLVHLLEPLVTDAQMRLSKADGIRVVIVMIGDDDYDHLFDRASPLDPNRLKCLIDAIAKGQPAVIGVDIDTSARKFRQFQEDSTWPPMVWEREVAAVPGSAGSADLEPLDVLGGQRIDMSRNSLGLSLLVDDADDGVTRMYRRMISARGTPKPSFPWAVAAAYWRVKEPKRTLPSVSTEDYVIRFSGKDNRLRLSASQVLRFAQDWPQQSPIRGAVVLLGGAYLNEDRHETPVGQMAGVDVLGFATETELNGVAEKRSRIFVFVLELLEAFVLVGVFHRYEKHPLHLVLICAALLVLTFAIGVSHRGWSAATPIVLGLMIFEGYLLVRKEALMGAFHLWTGGESTN